MNERIKELAKQATIHSKEGFYTYTQIDEQKFAELIVRECISVMDTTAKEAWDNMTYMDNDVPTTSHQYEIRKHFGVEE